MKGRRELDIREQLVSTTGPLSTSPIFSNKAIMVFINRREDNRKENKMG